MKKEIRNLIILTIILVAISTIVIHLAGKTYIAEIKPCSPEGELELTNETGEVKILAEKKEGDTCLIKVQSVKPGRVFLKHGNDEYATMILLYIHKSGIITDNNYFGKSTYSEVIPISVLIILCYILYLLIKHYRKCVKTNLYQYKNVAFLGIIIFLISFILDTTLSLFHYNGLYDTIASIISSVNGISIYLFPLALITAIPVTISNIKLLIKEGRSLKNLLGVFLGLFFCILPFLPNVIYNNLLTSQKINIFNLNSPGPYIYNFFEALIYLSVAYLECILIGTIIIAVKAARKKLEYNKDYMIILGCQIKKDGSLTPLLKGRVDKAIEFRNKQLEATGKDLIFIPSGGKGNDEIISEAEAMKNYLIEQGIPKKNILIDNKSKNTYENIKFSNKLVTKKNANIAFSTTKYHIFRAGLIATNQGLLLEGIGSKTKSYFWINAFIREFIGTLYSEKKKHFIVLLIIIIVLAIMILITYYANNI